MTASVRSSSPGAMRSNISSLVMTSAGDVLTRQLRGARANVPPGIDDPVPPLPSP